MNRKEWRVPSVITGDETGDPGAYLRSVVRLFPDYANSVLWFVGGPVDYAESRLSDGLTKEMDAWDRAYYAAVNDDDEWRSSELSKQHAAEGLRLARCLSDELGDAFEVEVFGERDEFKMRLLGLEPGTNPAAVAAFREWAQASAIEDAHVERLKASGAKIGIARYAPLGELPSTAPQKVSAMNTRRVRGATVVLLLGALLLVAGAVTTLLEWFMPFYQPTRGIFLAGGDSSYWDSLFFTTRWTLLAAGIAALGAVMTAASLGFRAGSRRALAAVDNSRP